MTSLARREPSRQQLCDYATKVFDPGRPLARALRRVTHQDDCPRRAELSQNPEWDENPARFLVVASSLSARDKAPTSVRGTPALSVIPPKGDGPRQGHYTKGAGSLHRAEGEHLAP